MERNRSVDIIRAVAVLWIIIYHTFAIACGQGFGPRISIPVLQDLVIYGGEIGVTLFFIMSGYGLYCSFNKSEGSFKYGKYLLKRFQRVMPEYYVHLFIVLLLGGGAGFVSRAGFKHVLTHVLFIHNLIPETARTISGTLWTMGTIVQFYFFAPLLYKLVKKNKYIALVGSVVFTILVKYIVFHIVKVQDYGDLGREVYTALDNFVLGMFVASLADAVKKKIGVVYKILLFLLAIAALIGFLLYSNTITVYSDTYIGYVWHSILAIILSIPVFVCAVSPFTKGNFLTKALLFIADNEYGIYLYQLVIIENLLVNSSTIRTIAGLGLPVLMITIILISTVVGAISSKCVRWQNIKKIFVK